jgi:hypothetical protein
MSSITLGRRYSQLPSAQGSPSLISFGSNFDASNGCGPLDGAESAGTASSGRLG